MRGSDWPGGWDPFEDLQREMGRLFQSLDPFSSSRRVQPFPPINLHLAGDEYILSAQLPGMTPEEVELTVTHESLTLRGERKRAEGIKDDSYRRQERVMGRWSRTINLPDRIDESRVTAQFSNGVLIARLPRAEGMKARHIVVSSPGAVDPNGSPSHE